MNSHPPMQSPPPPPPAAGNLPPQQPPAQAVGQSGFAPSQHTPGAARAKNIVLGLLAVFILLPILAIFALTTLGRTVEPGGEFSQVAAADAPPALAFNDPAVPAGAELFTADNGGFSIWVDPSWPEPVAQPEDAAASNATFWILEQYSTATFQGNINVARVPLVPGATLDSVAEAETDLTRSLLELSNVEQRDEVVNGTTVRVLSFEGTFEGTSLSIVSAFRIDDGFLRMATVGIPIEFAGDAESTVVPYLLTVSGPGAAG